ncbi:MAG: FecR family protein [Flavisolibacter sp.]
MNEALNENNTGQIKGADRVGYLISGYIQNTLTERERDELDEWVTASEENMQLFAELTDEKNIEKGLRERGLYNAEEAVQRLKTRISTGKEKKLAKKVRLFAYGIAASLLIIAGVLFLTPVFLKKKTTATIAAQAPDLLPGTDKATLTLSNGKTIVLNSATGNILHEDDLNVINLDGKISYEGKTNEIAYHTLTTPRGGQYKLLLPDGTAVWLNAATSLKYPTAFTGNERVVELNGEGYFEVAKDKTKPFRVKLKNNAVVEVLGTHFNIMAYDDEPYIKTTLVEGAVKMQQQASSAVLAPGQQAGLDANGKITVRKNIDTDNVIAWKNGLFEFKDEPIEPIMRQVARWYNVSVRYEGKVTDHFNASIERSVPVSKLFKLLEMTDRVHFTIKDKTIIVQP